MRRGRAAAGIAARIIAIGALLPSSAPALDMKPVWLGTPFLECWVPERADVLRGVLILDGWPMDGRWSEACACWKFAILRLNSDRYSGGATGTMGLLSGDISKPKAVAYGLRRMAEVTGHPEVRNVPLVSTGFSRYSGPAQNVMAAFPGRALCFLNGSGGGTDGDSPKERLLWKSTPHQGLQCEWETIFSGGAKDQLLPDWWRRPAGNLSMMSVHWRVYHQPKTFADLGILFVHEVAEARIPAGWDPREEPVRLRSLVEENGWLGSHEGWNVPVEKVFETDNENAAITPFAEFAGDPERSSWLVSEDLAWAWRAFSSRLPLARIVEPGHANIALHEDKGPAPLGHLECGVRARSPFVVAVRSDAPDMARIELFANTVKLGESTTFTGGETALGNTRGAECRITATIEEHGVYALMARYTTRGGKGGWARPLPLVVWHPD